MSKLRKYDPFSEEPAKIQTLIKVILGGDTEAADILIDQSDPKDVLKALARVIRYQRNMGKTK